MNRLQIETPDGQRIEPKVRGQDRHGAGYYGAPRGKRTHKGVDYCCNAGDRMLSVSEGKVTKIGFPYSPNDKKKGHLRYVQVTDANGYDCRYFYVEPFVKVGDPIRAGEIIGQAQGLTRIYPGITDHFHFEVRDDADFHLDPAIYLAG